MKRNYEFYQMVSHIRAKLGNFVADDSGRQAEKIEATFSGSYLLSDEVGLFHAITESAEKAITYVLSGSYRF